MLCNKQVELCAYTCSILILPAQTLLQTPGDSGAVPCARDVPPERPRAQNFNPLLGLVVTPQAFHRAERGNTSFVSNLLSFTRLNPVILVYLKQAPPVRWRA